MSSSDRRRLVRFCLLRQQLCPICGNHICFSNKDKVYKCKNEDCDYIATNVNSYPQSKIANNDINDENQELNISSNL